MKNIKFEGIKVGGWFEVSHYRNGKLLSKEKVHNVLTNVYTAVASGLLGNINAQTAFGWMALGTDNTAPASSQTTLVAETVVSGLARVAVTPTRVTTTLTNDTLQFDKTFTSAGTASIIEVGIFNASSNGVMLCRALLSSVKNMLSGDTLRVTYKIKFSV